MIDSRLFKKLEYKKPFLLDNREVFSNIVGIDSEAYVTGEPFMFCTSKGDIIAPGQIPDIFFTADYNKSNFLLYNIRYDSGALLYHLPTEVLRELWSEGEADHNGFTYEYIPHKRLRIRQSKKEVVSFWDVAQFFYRMSLDNAAKAYLDAKKSDINTKNFTEKYVRRFWNAIAKYCIQDATLTAQLGEYLIKKLQEFGMVPTTIFSCASISMKYFCDNTNVVTSWRFWQKRRDLLEFSCDAYSGGKFEMTQRGSFEKVYKYDITSAYPYEIANLVDIRNAAVIRCKDYQKESVYGYLRVRIDNKGAHLPCGPKNKVGVVSYPLGSFYLTITKQEYDYISTLPNVTVTIIDALWMFVRAKRYPYRQVIKYLYGLKDNYKHKDQMLYMINKIIMNSYYGKMAQIIEKKIEGEKKYIAGAGWNPMYASVITANTRIQVTKIQNLLKDDCLAVHTDSVFTTKPIPKRIIKEKLGSFTYEGEGEGLLIACGMYQIGKTCAWKGFKPKRTFNKEGDIVFRDTWQKILKRFPGYMKIRYPTLNVQSWVDVMSKNHPHSFINVFKNEQKIIDLNCDTKRMWERKVKSRDLLKGPEKSAPKLVIDKKVPSFWN